MKSNIMREVEIKGDIVKLNTHAQEELTQEEFKRFYNQQLQDKNQLESTLSQKKEEFDKVKDVVETPEVLKLKETLRDAHKLLKKEQLVDEMKELEIKLNSINKDLSYMNKTIQQIKNN